MGLLDNVVEFYKNTTINMVSALSGIDSFSEEINSLEEVEIEIRIKKIQLTLSTISINIEKEKDNPSSIEELNKRYEDNILKLAYLASNNFNHIEKMLRLINNKNAFYECLEALHAYTFGDYSLAYKKLNNYIKERECFPGHFLLNLVFAKLLLMNREYARSKTFIRAAISTRPTNIDSHKIMLQVCEFEKNEKGVLLEQSIIKLLECDV